jgi:hypothetical protein
MTEKIISRLKALGMVPRDVSAGLLIHYKRDDRIRWEAVDGRTKEPFHVGSLVNTDGMYKVPWDVAHEGDWVILSPREDGT